MELLIILTALLANLTGLGAGDRAPAPVEGVAAVRTADAQRAAAVVQAIVAPRRPADTARLVRAVEQPSLDVPPVAPLYANRRRE